MVLGWSAAGRFLRRQQRRQLRPLCLCQFIASRHPTVYRLFRPLSRFCIQALEDHAVRPEGLDLIGELLGEPGQFALSWLVT